jgi:hypothetical protein
VVELRSRVVVPPGDTRVLGLRLLGGEVDYVFGLAPASVWAREAGPLLIGLALLAGSGLLRVDWKGGWRLQAAGACAAIVTCVVLWPLDAPVGITLATVLAVAWTLNAMLPSPAPAARLARLAVLVIVVAFATVMVGHAVDLPRQDDWPEIVHRLRLAENGQWDRMDWFAQSSQHRHAAPRLLLLAMAAATSWCASAFAWVAVLAHIGSWLSVVWLIRGELDEWAVLAFSLVWFSPAQYESFVWGWALHGGLTLLFSILAVVAVEARRGPVGVLLAIACCTLASYSTAPGLISWIVCVGLLMARRRRHAAVVLLLAAVSCGATYFARYVPNGEYAALQFRIVDESLSAREGIGVALGLFAQPLGLAPRAAALVGASLLSLLLLGARSSGTRRRLALAGLGLAWWLATVLGRYDGTTSMLAISRYGWTVLPLWALLASTPRPRVLRAAALALCAIGGVQGWANGGVAVDGWRSAMETQRDELLAGYSPTGTALHWAPEVIPGMLEDLRRWRYSLYRNTP